MNLAFILDKLLAYLLAVQNGGGDIVNESSQASKYYGAAEVSFNNAPECFGGIYRRMAAKVDLNASSPQVAAYQKGDEYRQG